MIDRRTLKTAKPLIDQISLDEKTGCWNWRGSKYPPWGYGRAWFHKKSIRAHRLAAHLWLRMPLDDKRQVLHKCDNPACFNPKHLYIGTQSDNMWDAVHRNRHFQAKKMQCKNGHPFTAENLLPWDLRRGVRRCRICYNKRKGLDKTAHKEVSH